MSPIRLSPAVVSLIVLLGGPARADSFPEPIDTQATEDLPLTPAREALQRLVLPPGFHATLFAAEPDIRQPIAMAFDARGRLWVAENYTYGDAATPVDRTLRDRIVVFEDSHGDGHGDRRHVFWDRGHMLTSIAIGCGGVFALCPPQLLFIPTAGGELPSGEPQVLLDGFDVMTARHTVANGLKWGPDGWLYGRHGILATSHVGRPGAAASQRVVLNCGIWRYHPLRKVIEVVANGTTNPWGMDWDAQGEGFFINTVIGHLWYLIPGAHYRRMYGEDPDPHAYGAIEQHADHVHWATGEAWTTVRSGGPSDATAAAGGGHAHSGLMIYQGRNWPACYRGALFTLNFHGRRVNMDTLAAEGSGFIGHHAPDAIVSSDPWFRGIDLASGPDGGVFILDWSDIGECHERDGIHRNSGRIFKVVYGSSAPQPPAVPAPGPGTALDLERASDAELVAGLADDEEWLARMASRQLQDRAAAGSLEEGTRERLAGAVAAGGLSSRLRALWALHATGGASTALLLGLLMDPAEPLRMWAIRLLSDAWPLRGSASSPAVASIPAEVGAALRACAEREASPRVRLALASCLQRLPLTERAAIARPLLAHGEDANDHNLPLMLWFGIKDLAGSAPGELASCAYASRIPLITRLVARRFGEDAESHSEALDQLLLLAVRGPPVFQAAIAAGLGDALAGWRRCLKPASWDAFRTAIAANAAAGLDPATPERCTQLDTLFGSGQALSELVRVARDPERPTAQRRTALRTVIDSRPADLRQLCESLLDDQEINDEAVRGLALFDDPAIAGALIVRYRSGFHNEMKPAVLAALVSRASFARVLLDRLGDGAEQIPRSALTAFQVRQLRAFHDAAIDRQLAQVWGVQRDSPTALADEIRAWTARLTPAVLAAGNRSAGRLVFIQTCSLCHRLFGQGGNLGPDLTGSGRSNLAFLLESIVDPSAVVAADFRLVVATLSDGRVISGVITARTPRTLTIQTMTETVNVEQVQVAQLSELAQSPMPEGLLQALSQAQVVDLIAYLMGQDQVPLP